jgi:flagellar basal-body rod modification protein FlgD
MQIQNQSQTMDPAQLADTSSNSQAPATPTNINGLANENTFLQLLVAQIKNQDPLNPSDSVQFLSQLAQFSQLEQLIGIRSELKPATTANSTTPNGGTTSPTKTTN